VTTKSIMELTPGRPWGKRLSGTRRI